MGNCTGNGIFAKKSMAGSGSTGIAASTMSIAVEGGGPPPQDHFQECLGGMITEDRQIVSTARMQLY